MDGVARWKDFSVRGGEQLIEQIDRLSPRIRKHRKRMTSVEPGRPFEVAFRTGVERDFRRTQWFRIYRVAIARRAWHSRTVSEHGVVEQAIGAPTEAEDDVEGSPGFL